MTSPFLSRPLRSLQQAAAESGRVNCGAVPTAMELAAAPFSNTEVIGERVTERDCVRCHRPKGLSITPLCLYCRINEE